MPQFDPTFFTTQLFWLAVTFIACMAGGLVLHYLVERPLVEAVQRRLLRRAAV